MNRISRRTAAEEAEALLEVGRNEPVLHYDVELGLARHQQWMRSDAPLPEWAAAGVGTAARSLVPLVIKTLVSSVLLGVIAGGVWLARSRPQQPSAAVVTAASPAVEPAPASDHALAAAEAWAGAPRPLPVPDPGSPGETPSRHAVSDRRALRSPRAHKELASARSVQRAQSPDVQTAHVESTAPAAIAPSEGASAEPSARREPAAEPARKPISAVQKPWPEPATQPQPQRPDDLVEMQQVAAAEQLLARSPERALALVRQGDARFASGYFQQERAYIAIMALIRLGRIDEARTRAASFATRFPALPYGARIRSALEAAVP